MSNSANNICPSSIAHHDICGYMIITKYLTHFLASLGLWKVISVLQEVDHHQNTTDGLMDSRLLDDMVSKVLQLHALLSDKTGKKQHKIIHFM